MGSGAKRIRTPLCERKRGMKARALEFAIFLGGIGVLLAFAFAGQSGTLSAYSTFDTGPNGYQALFNVLRSENVPVDRLQQPLGLRDPNIRVLAFTSTLPEMTTNQGSVYDDNDYKQLAAFEKSGGRIVYFASPRVDPMRASIGRSNIRVTFLDATQFTNRALSERPQRIVKAFDILAGRGVVAFDERLHGYGTNRTLWSVLPFPVRAAFWIVVVAVLIVLVDANIRFAPAVVREPPAERDSAAYVASMAALLRRAHAGAAAIARFAKKTKDDDELQNLAQVAHPTDAMVVRAAVLAARQRKEGV